MVGSRDNSGEQRFALLSKSFGADEIYQESDTWKTGIGSSEFEEALNDRSPFFWLYPKE